MNKTDIAKIFWEHKILKWEMLRYSKWLMFYPNSWTIRIRLYKAIHYIKKHMPSNCSVIELGCGSGHLAKELINHIGSYTGIDIAENAIKVAQEKINKSNFKFKAADIRHYEMEFSDLTIFLGVSDWLSPKDLQELFLNIKSRFILFSFTEKKAVSIWNPYFYYRKLMDHKSSKQNYQARNFTEKEIREFLSHSGYSYQIISTSSLWNPGVLVWASK